MNEVWVVLLVCATASVQAVLKCRRCIGANSLDDCTFSVPCPSGEVCYMDAVLTEQRTVEYHGGCRPRDVCSRNSAVGKRSGSQWMCSHCCDTAKSPECNTKLCGISTSVVSANQCYYCESGVDDPNKCTSLVTCQSDQMCGTETIRLSTHAKYEFKCLSKPLCTLLTVEAMKRLDECRRPDADPFSCGGPIGKRDGSSGQRVCMACCGDSLCNSESCENLIGHLYNLWKAGVLDIHTLKVNASSPTTAPGSG